MIVSKFNAASQTTLITNASVLDGTGSPASATDVRIENGRISDVGRLSPQASDSILDARGLTLSPGFIDTHSHHDEGLFKQTDALAAVSQGITTIVVGQDGESHFPLAEFFSRLEKNPVAVNVASYVGHGTIRSRILGNDFKRAATAGELARMRELVREEMAAGALGLSTGLEYDPGIFSAPEEVLELAKVAGAAGGRYISHMRSEDRDFWQALDELINIGRVAKMPVQVSHMKLAMRALWGQGDRLIAKLDQARRDGVDVTADAYPYTMWQSTLTVLYPKRNFDDRKETEFILKQVAAPEDLVLGKFALEPSYVGKTVGEIAKLRGSDPATTLMALIAESQAKQAEESVIGTSMDERDVATILRWQHTDICSDGSLDGAHPRGFGTFSRVLGRYVREQGILTLNEAIRKMTSLPASNTGITDRGVIRPGMWADLVLFDPNTIIDQATLQQPHELSVGIKTVWVNGEVVFSDGKTTGKYPGRVVKRTSPGAAPNSEAAIDEFVRSEIARQRVPGVAIAILNKGKTITKGYGYANIEQMTPVTDESLFQSGSVGKMITATAVMMLVEDGKLALSDPLTKFFPDAPASWRKITVRHLLNHTSGIPDYTTSTFDYWKDYTEDELAHFAYQQRLEFPAGSRWNYSNTGYALLGFIIHKVSGKFYGDLLAERVFKPLGMHTARIINEADIIPNRAAGYQLIKGELKNQDWVAPKLNTTADGSIYWSLRDLVAWDAAVKQRKLLKADSWTQILNPARLNSGKTFPYGMGWSLNERNGKPLQEHGGSWQGFKAQIARFVDDDLDIIVLANLAEADPMRFVNGIAAIIEASLAEKPARAIEDREPKVTKRLAKLLETIREGKLTPDDFAYVRAGFFPDTANAYRDQLAKLGAPTSMELLEKKERGDDNIYLYKLTFATGLRYLTVGLAADGGISSFSMKREP